MSKQPASIAKCRYLVAYTSAVTGNRNWSGCSCKATADRQAKALIVEGACRVEVHPYRNEVL